MTRLLNKIIITLILVITIPIVSIYCGLFTLSEDTISKLPEKAQNIIVKINEDKNTTFKTPADAGKYIREQMASCKEHVEFTYKPKDEFNGDANALWDEFSKEIFKITPDGSEGEYLRYNTKEYDMKLDGNTKKMRITLSFKYYTTPKQEEMIRKEMANIEKDFNDGTDYQKVSAIYDYLTQNVSYGMSENQFSTYGALIEKKAVCNGFALSFYRLCKEAQLDVRCITGMANGEKHIWNAVNLGGKYYLFDTTWDVGGTHNFFAKGSDNFPNHISDFTITNISTIDYK